MQEQGTRDTSERPRHHTEAPKNHMTCRPRCRAYRFIELPTCELGDHGGLSDTTLPHKHDPGDTVEGGTGGGLPVNGVG
jgi:hypothetical protein